MATVRCRFIIPPSDRRSLPLITGAKVAMRISVSIRIPTGHPDWTFTGNAASYSKKRLRIFVRPVNEIVSPVENQIVAAASLPESTPWDLRRLSEPPVFDWAEGKEIRSLYYEGEVLPRKANAGLCLLCNTRQRLQASHCRTRNFRAVVLVHGGGGTAFSEWVKLWAKRGYAAIAMDLAGCGPKRVRLDDGGPGHRATI